MNNLALHFKLQGTELAYFDQADHGKKKGSIDLRSCAGIESIRASADPSATSTEIEIENAERTWRLRPEAEDAEASQAMWIEALQLAVAGDD